MAMSVLELLNNIIDMPLELPPYALEVHFNLALNLLVDCLTV